MTDTEKLAAEFPHIDALSRGCMSGKLIDWPQFQPECARIMGKLALAMQAIEAADKLIGSLVGIAAAQRAKMPVSESLFDRADGQQAKYIELRKKLEESR